MGKVLEKRTKKPLIIIPNGIDLKDYTFNSKIDIHNDLNIPLDEKIIVFVGRLHPIKGLNYLIKALHLIKSKNYKLALLIIGRGSEQSKLKNLVNEYNLNTDVYFIGEVKNKEIPNYLSSCDIFVLPSLSEGFPIVILEAMASGLPIVATNVGGLPDIIEENLNGFLIEPRNPDEIANKIIFLLNNPYECKKIGLYNKEYVKKYQWDFVIDKLEDTYTEVLKRRNL